MEGESGVTQRIIDEIHSSDIQGEQMEGESGVTKSIIDELYSSDIQGGKKEGEGGITRRVFFFAFLECKLNFQCFEKKMSLIGEVFLKLSTPTDVLL